MINLDNSPLPDYLDSPSVSVVIPTFNGNAQLDQVVLRIVNQNYSNFEILIVDDGSDNISEAYWKRLKSFSHKITIVHQTNQGRAISRNNGVLHSAGEIIIFLDDDIYVSETFIFDHVQFHLQNKLCVLVGRIEESCDKEDADFIHFKRYLSDFWQSNLAAKGLHKMSEEKWFLTAANFSIPRILLLKLNGFDSRLNDCEDYDLGIRLLAERVPIFFNPFILGIHNDKVTCDRYISRRREYNLAFLRLKELKPELLNEYNPAEKQRFSLKNKVLVFVFRFSFWKFFIDQLNLFIFLPKKIRYKIYEWVVYAGSFNS